MGEQLEAVHRGHAQVRDDEIEAPGFEGQQRLDAVAREPDLEAHLLEEQLQVLARCPFVLGDEDRIRHQPSPSDGFASVTSGNSTRTRAPPFSATSSASAPP